MPQNNDEWVKTLRDLAATCRDAEEGYNKAAKGVHNDESRAVFDQLSRERAIFASQLDEHIRALGGEAGDTGHGGGILRAGWVDLETRIRPKEDSEIIENCATGDEGGIDHYARALDTNLPEEIRATLRRHESRIRAAVEQLRSAATRH